MREPPGRELRGGPVDEVPRPADRARDDLARASRPLSTSARSSSLTPVAGGRDEHDLARRGVAPRTVFDAPIRYDGEERPLGDGARRLGGRDRRGQREQERRAAAPAPTRANRRRPEPSPDLGVGVGRVPDAEQHEGRAAERAQRERLRRRRLEALGVGPLRVELGRGSCGAGEPRRAGPAARAAPGRRARPGIADASAASASSVVPGDPHGLSSPLLLESLGGAVDVALLPPRRRPQEVAQPVEVGGDQRAARLPSRSRGARRVEPRCARSRARPRPGRRRARRTPSAARCASASSSIGCSSLATICLGHERRARP